MQVPYNTPPKWPYNTAVGLATESTLPKETIPNVINTLVRYIDLLTNLIDQIEGVCNRLGVEIHVEVAPKSSSPDVNRSTQSILNDLQDVSRCLEVQIARLQERVNSLANIIST